MRHQSEVHQFLAEFSISLSMSRSCSDYQSIKERNYDDFNESRHFFRKLEKEFILNSEIYRLTKLSFKGDVGSALKKR